MPKKMTLPSELDVLATPPLALLSILDVTLTMTVAAIHGEHPDLDEITGYFANGDRPPKSLSLAQTICNRADNLKATIDKYRKSLHDDILKMKYPDDLPF
jgi:hypothetical protein